MQGENISRIPISILHQFGLNESVIDAFKKQNISSLYPFQKDVLDKGLFDLKSFLIATPSGSGKTFIADLASIATINFHKLKVVYLVPLKALATEKSNHYSRLFQSLGLQIVFAVGDQDVSLSILKNCDILIATYEKFDSYLRVHSEHPWIDAVGCIIIDEVHLLGDNHRGLRLESLIVRLYQIEKAPQMIYLSATISNPDDIFKWLNQLEMKYRNNPMEFIHFNERPIPLRYSFSINPDRNNEILNICKKILSSQGQILIFTNSRRDTEKIVDFLISQIDFGEDFSSTPYFNRPICFHHAGLKSEDRIQIEQNFLQGLIKILVSTTTLSAGINLPARAVIIKEAMTFETNDESGKSVYSKLKKYQKKPMDRNLFHQICGRAGRPGYDDAGLVYLLAESEDEKNWMISNFFISSDQSLIPHYDIIESSFSSNLDHLEETLLVYIHGSKNISIIELLSFLKDTYFYSKYSNTRIPIESFLGIIDLDLISVLKSIESRKNLLLLRVIPTQLILKSWIRDQNFEFKIIFDLCSDSMKEKIMLSENLDQNGFNSYINTFFAEEREYILQISSNFGITCSCGKQIPFNFDLKHLNPNDKEMKGCIHISSLLLWIYYLNDDIVPNSLPQIIKNLQLTSSCDFSSEFVFKIEVQKVIKSALFSPNIIDSLIQRNLIQKTTIDDKSFNQYSCTPLGSLSVRSYLLPKYAWFIHEKFKQFNDEKNDHILQFIFEIIKDIIEIEENKHLDCFSEIIELWISEISIDQIPAMMSQKGFSQLFYSNDIIRILDNTIRFFRFIKEYIQLDFPSYNSQIIQAFFWRLKYGIKTDLIPWINFFGDEDLQICRKIINAGIEKPTQLMNKSIQDLMALCGLSYEICRKIQSKILVK